MGAEAGGWVSPALVLAPMRARDAADTITQLGALLFAAGAVKSSFVPAVIEREQKFATGLPTAGIHVAIPHTDVEHVLRDAIAVGVLEEPVAFGEMGNPDGQVQARIVCLLAATRAERVVGLLQRLADMFQQPQILEQIAAARDPAAIALTINHQLDGA